MMQHKDSHRPWDPAPDRLEDNTGKHYPEPETLFDDYENRSSAAELAEMRISNDLSVTGTDIKARDEDKLNGSHGSSSHDRFYGKMTQDQRVGIL